MEKAEDKVSVNVSNLDVKKQINLLGEKGLTDYTARTNVLFVLLYFYLTFLDHRTSVFLYQNCKGAPVKLD